MPWEELGFEVEAWAGRSPSWYLAGAYIPWSFAVIITTTTTYTWMDNKSTNQKTESQNLNINRETKPIPFSEGYFTL